MKNERIRQQKCEEEEEVSCFSIAPPPYSINSFVEGLQLFYGNITFLYCGFCPRIILPSGIKVLAKNPYGKCDKTCATCCTVQYRRLIVLKKKTGVDLVYFHILPTIFFIDICTIEYNRDRHKGVQIPNCWVKKATAWSIPASDLVAISSLSLSWKIFHRLFSNPCHGNNSDLLLL